MTKIAYTCVQKKFFLSSNLIFTKVQSASNYLILRKSFTNDVKRVKTFVRLAVKNFKPRMKIVCLNVRKIIVFHFL